MAEEILVNITPYEVRVALLENGILQEVYIERSFLHGLIGNIYKGRINRILPGIQAAFVDIGLERSAFLHVTDLLGYEEYSKNIKHPTDIDIRDFIHTGQEILVQIYKDPLGTKGARLTTQFTIPSRYLVFTPGVKQITVSQKIIDEKERQRLINMITPSEEGGYIFRTAAEEVQQAEVEKEKQFLETVWSEIKEKTRSAIVGDLVYEEIPIALRVLRDLVGYNVEKIRVDNADVANSMCQFANSYVPELVDRIETYQDDQPIFDLYSVETELQKALYRKVYLKSGGHLIFDQTEAMTTIDVNTGSFTGNNSVENTIFKTNMEAVGVIARQIRLRNLGGIIIIDFIDMYNTKHKEELYQALQVALVKDTAKIQMSEFTSLGLIQLTRKRARESLEHILCVACPLCQSRGSIKAIETVSYEIFRELKRVANTYSWPGYIVLASEQVIHCLRDEKSIVLNELQNQLEKPIKLCIESFYTQEQYNILPLSDRE